MAERSPHVWFWPGPAAFPQAEQCVGQHCDDGCGVSLFGITLISVRGMPMRAVVLLKRWKGCTGRRGCLYDHVGRTHVASFSVFQKNMFMFNFLFTYFLKMIYTLFMHLLWLFLSSEVWAHPSRVPFLSLPSPPMCGPTPAEAQPCRCCARAGQPLHSSAAAPDHGPPGTVGRMGGGTIHGTIHGINNICNNNIYI